MAEPTKSCFVIMPISDPADYPPGHFRRVYDHLIKPACASAGLEPTRADDVKSTNLIVVDILQRILAADLVICDLSARNPNVLFELGMRQAFDRPVVLIQDKQTERIFDIQGIRTLDYDHTLRVDTVRSDVDHLSTALGATLEAKPSDVNSLIRLLGIAKAVPRTDQGVSNDTAVVLTALKELSSRMSRLETNGGLSRPIVVGDGARASARGLGKVALPNGEVVDAGEEVFADGKPVGRVIGSGPGGVIVQPRASNAPPLLIHPDDHRYMKLTEIPF
jgi:hypothetical protein